MTVSWNIRPEDAWPAQVEGWGNAIEAEIVALVDSLLDPVEEWMKANHRWQNRTGAAEAGLYTDILHSVHQAVYLLMSHGPTVEYAVFLEYAHAGQFAVLGDTADNWWPVLYNGVVEILRRHSS